MKVARTNADFAERNFTRQTALSTTSSPPKPSSTTPGATATWHPADRRVEQQIAQIAPSLGGDPDMPAENQASYLEAKAARDQAALDLEHTVVRAPFAGIASNMPELGQYAAPGKAMMSVVAD